LIICLGVLGGRARFFIIRMFGGLVLVELTLNQAPRIGARPDQVLLGVAGFILIEFQLRLGDIQLSLNAF
jgi:hypothetical protein